MIKTLTMPLTRPVKKAVNKAKNIAYDKARALFRIAYAAVPAAAYAVSESKLGDINDMFFLKRWLAKLPIFYGNDIQKLQAINDYSAKGVGIASALLVGNEINKRVGRILPDTVKARKIAQILAYFTTANIANLTLNGADKLKDLSPLEAIASTAKDTIATAIQTAYNLIDSYQGSDIESIGSAGIMALVGLTGVKLTDLVIRSSPVQSLYSCFIGRESDAYEQRRIENHFDKKAKKMKKARENY